MTFSNLEKGIFLIALGEILTGHIETDCLAYYVYFELLEKGYSPTNAEVVSEALLKLNYLELLRDLLQ